MEVPAAASGLILPAGVLEDVGPIRCPAEGEVTPAERAVVAQAVAKRQREFLSGRAAARRLLNRLGFPATDLLPLPSRAPGWPPGAVGSISHCEPVCWVVAAPATVLAGIGVDCERDEALDPDLWDRICTPTELEWVASREPWLQGHWVRRFFSAKEAAYKCQHPFTGRFLGFQDVEIRFPAKAGRFRVGLARKEQDLEDAGAVLEASRGVWGVEAGVLFSSVFLAAANAGNLGLPGA